jgi:hypothetical protein
MCIRNFVLLALCSAITFFCSARIALATDDRSPQEQYKAIVENEAKTQGVTLDEIQKRIEASGGVYNYFSNQYLQGKLPDIADVLRILALSKGIQPLPLEQGVLSGDPQSIEPLRQDSKITVKEISYTSSIDNIGPLYAEIAYDPANRHMPIVVVQHGGNPGKRFGMVASCFRMAQNGMFAIAVSKRGRDGSAGQGDSWAKEIFDIIDAIEFVKSHYAENVDPTNVNIWGYSGGAIDSIAASSRFPDYFRCIAPFFGQFEWTTSLMGVPAAQRRKEEVAAGEQQKVNAIVDGIGGYPDEVPDNYMARDNMLGVINNPYSRIHLVLDEKDPSGEALQRHFREYYEKAKQLGYTNVELHLSKVGDQYRFHHDYPGTTEQLGNPDLMFAESFFLAHVVHGDYPPPILADSGIINVLGYVKTKRFFVWLGAGNDAVARMEYTLGGRDNAFLFRRLSSRQGVKGRLIFPNPQRYPLRVTVNGNAVVDRTTDIQVRVDFTIDDRIVISRASL